MLGDGALGFREFAMREPLPLARIQQAVLEFLRDRDDAVLFGAQAVNADVEEPRMTQHVDILSPRAAELAEELKQHLAGLFGIATRTRQVGRGWRVFQVVKPKNRHLADIRPSAPLPPANRIDRILVVTPPELITEKVIAYQSRKGDPSPARTGGTWPSCSWRSPISKRKKALSHRGYERCRPTTAPWKPGVTSSAWSCSPKTTRGTDRQPAYSYRSASSGSTRVARRAGR